MELERFRPSDERDDYFLIVTELVPHKRVELALEAAERAGVEVRVVGEGGERERLEARYGGAGGHGRSSSAGSTTTSLARLYSRARALILPNVEEFGIAAVEAQASGRPVVAVAAGGALETVIDGVTGVHVELDDVEALAASLAGGRFRPLRPRADSGARPRLLQGGLSGTASGRGRRGAEHTAS